MHVDRCTHDMHTHTYIVFHTYGMAVTIPSVGCKLFIDQMYLYRSDIQLFIWLKIVLLLLIGNMSVYLHLHVAYCLFFLLFLLFRFWIMFYFVILIEVMCVVTLLNRIFGTPSAPGRIM